MEANLAEFLGTALLILLGNGVVANVVLKGTKGHGSGWIVICAGWGFAVFIAVVCVGEISGAHINPAVTLGLAVAGRFAWAEVPGYVIAQMAGAILGGGLVFLFYQSHYTASDDADGKLATFCTAPAIRKLPSNLLSEVLGTFVLILAVLLHVDPSFDRSDRPTKTAVTATVLDTDQASVGDEAAGPTADEDPKVKVGLGSIGALEVGLVVFGIGLSLGGTTGYAINPARDLGPRIAHTVLPIPGKRDSDWSYAVIPVAGPLIGAVLAAWLAGAL